MRSHPTLLSLSLLALSSPLMAATPAGRFPADSPEPMTSDETVRALPVYEDGAASAENDADAGAGRPGAPGRDTRGKTQTVPSQFGMTLITPVAATIEQRIPVSMNRGASGRMGAWSYGGEASVQRVAQDFYAYVNFNYRRSDFTFDGNGGPAPWEDLDQYRLSTHVEGDISGNWRWFVDGGVVASLETNGDFGDSVTGRGALGAKYRFSKHFAYYFGLTAVTRLDRDAIVVPFTAFEIRFDRWTIRSLNGIVASYDLFGDNSLTFDLSATYENTFFRRTDDPAGARRTVEFQEVPVTFGATQSLGRYAFVRGYVTAIAWSDYRFATQGRTTGDFQTDPGVLFGLSAGLRF